MQFINFSTIVILSTTKLAKICKFASLKTKIHPYAKLVYQRFFECIRLLRNRPFSLPKNQRYKTHSDMLLCHRSDLLLHSDDIECSNIDNNRQ